MKQLKQRGDIIAAVRRFFSLRGYLEVETPIRIPAPAPEAHIDGFESEGWYLQASPEICMKRLVASGHEKIFQICKCFRKEAIGERHLTEMTLLEWYTANDSYTELMDQCRDLIRFVAEEIGAGQTISWNGHTIDLAREWERVSVADVFERHGPVSMDQALFDKSFDEIMGFDIEPCLGTEQPCFVCDYPASMAALAKLTPPDNTLAQRFELYIAGIELANGFSELTDPAEQKERFEKEMAVRAQAGKAPMPMPEPFLKDLAAMPESSGIALGMDRLVMLFTDARSIDRVVAFTENEL
ncbi:MAG TPA: EF-P lysine aminoacylase EpmA [Desulfobacteraceae bacterium]|nr:EF-P lysine aminoacylase EpmA [Desulfobacteraceae bacterium]